jgi:primosomal protein N'
LPKKEPEEKYYCPECLEEVDPDAIKCPHCGAEYEAGEEEAGFECMICGNEVEPNAKYCERCGTLFLDDVEEGDTPIKQIGEHGKKRKGPKDMEQDDT